MLRAIGQERGMVRLFRDDPDGRGHMGLGVLVDDLTVVTCAHVVNDCLRRGRSRDRAPRDTARVRVSFPILGDRLVIESWIIGWSPPGGSGLDCAVLRLAQPAPDETGRAVLTSGDRNASADRDVTFHGACHMRQPGVKLSARLVWPEGASRAHLTTRAPMELAPGFSGAGVWDAAGTGCIGILVTAEPGSGATHGHVPGHVLDAARIRAQFSDLLPWQCRVASVGMK